VMHAAASRVAPAPSAARQCGAMAGKQPEMRRLSPFISNLGK
jgi:hypothetical protein